MEFSRQEYWSRLPFPTPGNFNNPKIKPTSPALASRFFTTEPAGESTMEYYSAIKMNQRMPFAATRIDQEIIILSEVRKTMTQINISMEQSWTQRIDLQLSKER